MLRILHAPNHHPHAASRWLAGVGPEPTHSAETARVAAHQSSYIHTSDIGIYHTTIMLTHLHLYTYGRVVYMEVVAGTLHVCLGACPSLLHSLRTGAFRVAPPGVDAVFDMRPSGMALHWPYTPILARGPLHSTAWHTASQPRHSV